jgi:hypothetical protein
LENSQKSNKQKSNKITTTQTNKLRADIQDSFFFFPPLLSLSLSLSLSLLPHGYLCDSSRRNVTALDLSGFNLSGALSPDLGVSRSGLCRNGKSSEDRLVDAADADDLFRRNKSDPLIVVVTDCLKEQIMA